MFNGDITPPRVRRPRGGQDNPAFSSDSSFEDSSSVDKEKSEGMVKIEDETLQKERKKSLQKTKENDILQGRRSDRNDRPNERYTRTPEYRYIERKPRRDDYIHRDPKSVPPLTKEPQERTRSKSEQKNNVPKIDVSRNRETSPDLVSSITQTASSVTDSTELTSSTKSSGQRFVKDNEIPDGKWPDINNKRRSSKDDYKFRAQRNVSSSTIEAHEKHDKITNDRNEQKSGTLRTDKSKNKVTSFLEDAFLMQTERPQSTTSTKSSENDITDGKLPDRNEKPDARYTRTGRYEERGSNKDDYRPNTPRNVSPPTIETLNKQEKKTSDRREQKIDKPKEDKSKNKDTSLAVEMPLTHTRALLTEGPEVTTSTESSGQKSAKESAALDEKQPYRHDKSDVRYTRTGEYQKNESRKDDYKFKSSRNVSPPTTETLGKHEKRKSEMSEKKNENLKTDTKKKDSSSSMTQTRTLLIEGPEFASSTKPSGQRYAKENDMLEEKHSYSTDRSDVRYMQTVENYENSPRKGDYKPRSPRNVSPLTTETFEKYEKLKSDRSEQNDNSMKDKSKKRESSPSMASSVSQTRSVPTDGTESTTSTIQSGRRSKKENLFDRRSSGKNDRSDVNYTRTGEYRGRGTRKEDYISSTPQSASILTIETLEKHEKLTSGKSEQKNDSSKKSPKKDKSKKREPSPTIDTAATHTGSLVTEVTDFTATTLSNPHYAKNARRSSPSRSSSLKRKKDNKDHPRTHSGERKSGSGERRDRSRSPASSTRSSRSGSSRSSRRSPESRSQARRVNRQQAILPIFKETPSNKKS